MEIKSFYEEVQREFWRKAKKFGLQSIYTHIPSGKKVRVIVNYESRYDNRYNSVSVLDKEMSWKQLANIPAPSSSSYRVQLEEPGGLLKEEKQREAQEAAQQDEEELLRIAHQLLVPATPASF